MENRPFKLLLFSAMIISTLAFQRCDLNKSGQIHGTEKNNEFISIKDQNFIDPSGRTMILHGINVVNKDPDMGYLGHISPDDFTTFKSWGFNVVRLGIIWDGLEHEPGVYNEEYLHGIDEMIKWAGENNIYVFLDMHQDLYSVQFSDGAPEWATITNDQPHQTGEVWSDAYLISPAVQAAFDHFWNNTPALDGIGIQDHYINLWKYLAKRYNDNSTVIGFDIMNEPFMGSGANQVMPLLLQAYAKLLVEQTGHAPPSEEELMYMWGTASERIKVLETLSKKEVYKKIINAVYEVNAEFEKGPLTAFFQKARNAIREVNKNHIIFIEHSYFTNMGVTGALQPLLDEHGNPDPLVAYAAHGYDLVVDTEAIANGSNERVELIFERIAETGKRLNIPVLIGEWGALHGKSPDLIPVADHLMNVFNKHGFSDTFWAYGKFLHESSFLEVLKKPYPVATSGELVEYAYDYDTGKFSCIWTKKNRIQAPTIIYLSDIENLQKDLITVTPEVESIEIENINNSPAGYLIIPSSDVDGVKSLELILKSMDHKVISLLE